MTREPTELDPSDEPPGGSLGQALTDLTRSEDPATAAARLARVEGHLDDPSYHLDVVDHALQSVGFALEKPGSPPALLLDDNTGQGWYRGKLAATLDPATLAWRLLRTIATRGDELNQESLYTEVWQAPYRPPSSRNTLYVSMHRLRTVARAAALDIDRTSEGGYRLRGGPAVWAWKGRPARSRTAAASTNIRASLDPFFGHHGLFNALSQELGPNTLLTLRGPPGCGKSRVARELALKMLEAGRIQEAWRCSLAGADGLLGILRAVAEPLGLPVAGMKSADSLADDVGRALAGRGPILLVLDNADRVVDELGTLARRWLTAAPNLMLLATSRTPLGVEAELVRVVEPLPVPASDATADEIGECLAVQLFLARARATQPTLALDEDTRDDLAEVVRMLDGLPLALELAAARARVLPPRALRARLDKHRLEVLASGRGTGRRAIRDALDASWDVLLTHERSALAQLSVFPHRFSLDQAEAVLALDDVWPLDIVTGLSDHSLVCIEEVAGQPWLRLYGSVRSYALEQSESLGIDRGALELRFIQAHVREPADVAAEVHGPNGQRVLDQLAEELDNRLEAVRIALGRGSPGLAAKVLRVAGHATHRGVPATLLAQHATAVLESGLEDGALRSAMLRLRGATSIPAGRWDVAEADAAEAARLADQTEDAFLRASAAALVAFVKAHRGEPTEAISACERALELARTAPNGQHWEGAALTALATARRRTQDLDGAEQAILSDLAIRRSIQDRNYEAYALQALASIEMARRNGDRARPMLEAALAIQREIGDRRAEGILLGNLGLVHHHARSWDDARTAMEAALAIHEEQGNARFQCLELGNLAAVALGRGDTARAMQFYEAAYGLAEQTNNPLVAGNSASALGEIALGSSDLDGADRWLHRAEQPLRQAGNPVYLARALWRRARLLAERADVESAGLILAEAEALVAPLGAHLKLAGRLADLRRQLFGSPPAASN